MSDEFGEIARAREAIRFEVSAERFDRVAFAMRALAFVKPQRTTVAVCEGRALRVESGRAWGRGEGARWAMLVVPTGASRRAIALAVSELAGPTLDAAYAYDVLLRDTMSPAA
jgi:hypothetical protein